MTSDLAVPLGLKARPKWGMVLEVMDWRSAAAKREAVVVDRAKSFSGGGLNPVMYRWGSWLMVGFDIVVCAFAYTIAPAVL